jgi:hypothetical protein
VNHHTNAPEPATLLFLRKRGTVPPPTSEEVTLRLEPIAADQDALEGIIFTSHRDSLELVKNSRTRVCNPNTGQESGNLTNGCT